MLKNPMDSCLSNKTQTRSNLAHSPLYYSREIAASSGTKTSRKRADLEQVLTSLQQQNQHLTAQLDQAQKMSTVGTLACGLSHDFNNILTAMMGFAELALMTAPLNSSTQQHLQKVATAGLRAKNLVNQVLNISRQSTHDQKTVALSPLVEEVLDLLRSSGSVAILVERG